MARPARDYETQLDPAMPVALYLELRARGGESARLEANATAFCQTHSNATLYRPATRPRHLSDNTVVVYLAIDCGPLHGAARGEAAARQALVTLVAATTELFAFDPVLVPRPAGFEPPAADFPDRPRGAP